MRIGVATACLLVSVSAGPAVAGQSLGQVAADEAARRQGITAPARVITNADLRAVPSSPSVEVPATDAAGSRPVVSSTPAQSGAGPAPQIPRQAVSGAKTAVEATVGSDGPGSDIAILRGAAPFTEFPSAAVREWPFAPADDAAPAPAGQGEAAVDDARVASEAPDAQIVDRVAPAAAVTMTRDESGTATVRATRLNGEFALDGRLTESLYTTVLPYTGFLQQEPEEGEPATEATEVWLFYDDKNIYIGARLHESEPTRRVASEMRRDSFNSFNNDHLAVIFDTFNDHRNGFGFAANRLGGMFDWSATNEQPSPNWNGLWWSQAADFEGGWTIEMRIPFRSIRFREGSTTWGVNFRRMVRWKNEISYLNVVPRSWGRRGLNKLSSEATLTGLETPRRGANIDLKPYVLGSMLTNRLASPAFSNRGDANFGGDAKWGITQQLVADFTYNTDFAQVEDDEAQVNLTRFSLFFPEKRDFFLEGQDAFAFGGVGGGGGGGNNNPTPILFYSRRIGLVNGGVAPIIGGARVLGRAGAWQVGALSMQTDDVTSLAAPSTNFSVLRVNRDVLSRSRVGMIATTRAPQGGGANNYAAGADALINVNADTQINAYWARTESGTATGDQSSYRGRFDWNADRYGINAEHLYVGEGFDPQVGFLRRQAFRRSYGQLRFSPRPTRLPGVRKLYYNASADYFTGAADGRVQSEEYQGQFNVEFNNGDFFNAEVSQAFEAIVTPFDVARGVAVPAGEYRFTQTKLSYFMGLQRRISGGLTLGYGGFYDGTLAEATWRGRVEFTPQFYAEPTLSWNRVDAPYGTGNANLVSTRLTYTVTPRMFVAALVQYQSLAAATSANLRFRWEYQPGSELFVVYSDGRTTTGPGFPALQSRSVVMKVTKLFRW